MKNPNTGKGHIGNVRHHEKTQLSNNRNREKYPKSMHRPDLQ